MDGVVKPKFALLPKTSRPHYSNLVTQFGERVGKIVDNKFPPAERRKKAVDIQHDIKFFFHIFFSWGYGRVLIIEVCYKLIVHARKAARPVQLFVPNYMTAHAPGTPWTSAIYRRRPHIGE
jgi:hypothetical protein